MAIGNKNQPTYDIEHIYVADSNDDNAERKMLKEARVDEVTITEDGSVSFRFKLAGSSSLESPDSFDLYYDAETYRAANKTVSASYSLISALLEKLGVDSSLYASFKANPNALPYLIPQGYFINDKTTVEAVEFPATWIFTRKAVTTTVTKEIEVPAEDGSEETTTTTTTAEEVTGYTWSHNANFYGKDIYATREAALKNHKIKLLRLDGTEDEV